MFAFLNFCLNTSAASFTNHTEMQGRRLVDAWGGGGAQILAFLCEGYST